MKFSFSPFSSFISFSHAFCGVFLSTLVVTSQAAQQPEEPQKNEIYQSLMVGGGIKVCSRYHPDNCAKSASTLFDETKALSVYQLGKETFADVMQTTGFQDLAPTEQTRLKQLFQHFYANPVNVNSPEDIRQAFRRSTQAYDAGTLFSNLPNEVYYAILDYAQQSASPSQLVDFPRTQNVATKRILAEFIDQANLRRQPGEKLRLSFITAAARDPFAQVRYYQQLLKQVAEQVLTKNDIVVSWLALDQSLMQALADKAKGLTSCERLESYRNNNQLFNAVKRYPEHTAKQAELCRHPEQLQALLKNSHGLLISDDAPADTPSLRLLSLFRDSQQQPTGYQQIILDRQQNGDLFVAGIGAGAAVMAGGVFENRPVPYITGGTSDVALIRGAFAMAPAPFGCEKDGNCPYGLLEDDLTYESRGGLGSFHLGAIDTDFSEQSRHARLAVMAAASKTRFGFGIDANTALLYRQTAFRQSPNGNIDMQVLGENGLFLVDMRDAIVKTQSGKHQIIGMSHYINSGDQVSWSHSEKELAFTPSQNSESLNGKTMILPRDKGEFRRNVTINCGTKSFHRWTENNIAWLFNPTEETAFYRNRNGDMENCSYHNLLFGIEN